MAITFTPGPVCAGGNHFDVEVDYGDGEPPVTVSVTLQNDIVARTPAEKQQHAKGLVLDALSTAGNKAMPALRANLAAHSVGRLP